MDLVEIECDEEKWIYLAEDRVKWRTLLNKVMNFWIP
jgi:hypothetical protein